MAIPLIISSDECKEYFPLYDPNNADSCHEDSARLADKFFSAAVKHIPVKVIILAGGSASGKTEYLSSYVDFQSRDGGVFFDGTLPSFTGAEIKIKQLIECKREFEIHFILPEDIKKAFLAFHGRERQFNESHFFRTHSQSRKTALEIQEKFPDIHIRIIGSSFQTAEKTMDFEEQLFASSSEKIEFLTKIQYSENEIKEMCLWTE